MISKKVLSIFFILMVLFFLEGSTVAEENKYCYFQLVIRDDRRVEEKITFTPKALRDKALADSSSSKLINSIEEYTEMGQAFPLEVQVKNRILWDNYIIRSNYGKNKLVDELISRADQVVFSLQIPGIISESSAARKEGNTLIWTISAEEKPDIYVNAAVIDGFRLALFILGIGILLAFGYFIGALLRVNRIIEEEYSLDTAKMPETKENNRK